MQLGSTEDLIVAVVLFWTLTYMVDELRQLAMLGWTEWWGGQGGTYPLLCFCTQCEMMHVTPGIVDPDSRYPSFVGSTVRQ